MGKRNIILLAPSIHTGGGTERVLVNLGNELINKGYNVQIVVNIIGENEHYELNNSILLKQFWFGKIRSKHSNSKLVKLVNKLFGKWILELFLKKIIQRRHMIIISFSNGLTLDCYNTKFKSNLIAFEHWPYWITHKHPKLQNKIKKVYPKLKKVILLTEKEKNIYEKLGCNNIEVIPNVPSFIPNHVAELENKIVLSVGHFNEQKRRDLLVRAWKFVNEKHNDWKLKIIGKGHLKTEVVDLIKKLGLQYSIEIIDPTSNIEKQYLNASIFVLSSEFEALPMVLIEAKTCGLPCVSYDIESGPSEIINNLEDGFLVPFPNTKDFAAKICKLIENKYLRQKYGAKARKDAIKRFNPDYIYDQWSKMISEFITE